MGWFKPGSLQQIIAWRTGSDYGDAAPCNPERCLGGRVSRQHLALEKSGGGVEGLALSGSHLLPQTRGPHRGSPAGQSGRFGGMGPWSETTDPLSLLDLVGRVVSPSLRPHPPVWWALSFSYQGPSGCKVCLWGQEPSVVEQGREQPDKVLWG